MRGLKEGHRMARSELFQRVVVAALGIPVVLGALYAGGMLLGLLLAAVSTLGAIEFYRLAEARGARPFVPLGAFASGALVLVVAGWPTPEVAGPNMAGGVLALLLVSLAASVWLRWPDGHPLSAVSVTVTGVLYTGATLAFVPLLRELSGPFAVGVWQAMGFVLLPLFTTWAGDSAGYFVGRAWGRTKLAPAVSPGKTIVGAVAGLAGSSLAAVALSLLLLSNLPSHQLLPLTAAWIGLLLGAVGQLGDLVESMLKREAGVKDSGSLLPGHGGILDRTDSLLFSVPAAWALLRLTGVV